MKTKFIILILIAGLLTACGSQTTEVPASQPTEEPASAISSPSQAEVSAPPPASTDTAIPSTEIPTKEPTAESVSTTGISFSNDVLPIIQSRCVNCHGGQKVEEGLVLKTYSDIISGSNNGPVIVAGDAGNSLLIELITKLEMPKKGPKLTPPQIQLITDWVNQGALNN
jgi:uncharacterized membrane protein